MSQGGKKGQRRTTGYRCDGCGRPKGQVVLIRKIVISAGARIAMDYCARCLRLDAEEHGEVPPRVACAEARLTVPF